MKIKFNTNLLVNTIIIGFIVLGISNWIVISSNFGSKVQYGVDTIARYKWLDTLKPIELDISDTLRHSEYIKLEDSIKKTRRIKNLEFPVAQGASCAGLIGITGGFYCNNCSVKQFYDLYFKRYNHEENIRYFIDLLGWKINNSTWAVEGDSVQFHVEEGKYYVRKAIKYPKEKLIKVIDEPVKFKYDIQQQGIMIPISKSTRNIVNTLLVIMFVLFGLCYFYLISAFLKFILDLSKGLAFTTKNVNRLKLISISLIAWPFMVLFFDYFFRMLFNSYFTTDVVFNWEEWRSYWKVITVGLIFLALYKAFRQGKKLKDEQEFTI